MPYNFQHVLNWREKIGKHFVSVAMLDICNATGYNQTLNIEIKSEHHRTNKAVSACAYT